MALTINTNVASLNAQRNLGTSQSSLNKSMQRLSSGLRINSAKDDAAGLAISSRMTSQIRGINQSVRNANDGISLAQTAEGAMGEITNILQRMRELTIQSANDSNSASDRESLQEEVSSLISEIDRIAATTEFNETKVLNGAGTTLNFQVGARGTTNDQISISLSSLNMVAASAGLGVDAVNIGSTFNAAGSTTAVNLTSAVNVAWSTLSAGTGGTFASTTVTGASTTAAGGGMTTASALTALDDAIGKVDSARGTMGAVQNRFESTIANLSNIAENVTAARSRIMDADIAAETSAMTKYNILQQAGVSILAQANQSPQLALSLLG